MAIQRLTAAYRSRSRPSSTLGAKASTMCPYYLDGDLLGERLSGSPGDTRLHWLLCSFQGPRRGELATPVSPGPRSIEPPAASRSLKTQQHAGRLGRAHWRAPCGLPGSVDISSGRIALEASAAELRELRRRSSGDRCPRDGGLPRKEVIQPQLPLRLPCYDFTPVTSPTFDGSLPKGLGHRLRVLLTPMV